MPAAGSSAAPARMMPRSPRDPPAPRPRQGPAHRTRARPGHPSAVKASDQQAISDYRDIQLKRDREAAQPSTPEPMAPITAQDDTRDGDRLRHLTAEQTNTERGST